MSEEKFRVGLANLVNLVAANEYDIVEAILAKRLQHPVEDAAALDLREALGRVGRGGHQPNATSGADDYGFHVDSSPVASPARVFHRQATAAAAAKAHPAQNISGTCHSWRSFSQPVTWSPANAPR